MDKCYTYEVKSDETILNYQINMIKNNNIENLLKFKQIDDHDIKFYYYNDGLISLDDFIKINGINISFLKDLLIQLKNILEENEKFFLSKNNYLMNTQRIYISLENLNIRLIYIPFKKNKNFVDNLNVLIKDIVYENLEIFNLNKFNREKILKICNEKMSINKIINCLDHFDLNSKKNKNKNNKNISQQKKDIKFPKKYLFLMGYLSITIIAFYLKTIQFDLINLILIISIGTLIFLLIHNTKNLKTSDKKSELNHKKTIMINEYNNKYQLVNLKNGEIISLKKDYIVLGRSPAADIILKDQYVGRRHCVLLMKEGNVYIKDLNSKNGVFINNEIIQSNQLYKLSEHDTVEIAETPVKISKSSN